MENKQSPSKTKLISIHEEKLIRKVDYDSIVGPTRLPKKELLLDLEILKKNTTHRQSSQRVLVSIKPRAPAIKTIYIAEKCRFNPKKCSEKSRSRLAIGDHSSFTTHCSENESNLITYSNECGTQYEDSKSKTVKESVSSIIIQVENTALASKCSQINRPLRNVNVFNTKRQSGEKCYIYSQRQINMNPYKVTANRRTSPNKVDIATLIVTNTSSEDIVPSTAKTLTRLNKRIDHLERKIQRQEMVFRSIDPNIPLSSSDEETKENIMRSTSASGRPGCSYIEHYSHVPETSAFQRYAQQAPPLSPSKATTLEKEHNSEQYGRDFTTYDGITARGRRQCASVPCKRDEVPKLAAERVHKIRHKLNPVRDYRLMDTVHYLAQGEFAPRDDGIKLTPSREAVLSDIIWEDVCRTHWPNARLGRRGHPERCNDRGTTRGELQRLIDSLLRERVAHVERRRRRHYRIVKLNHRHESCRPMGKTGDIIVASHKNRQTSDDVVVSDQNTDAMVAMNRRRGEMSPRRTPRSFDRLMAADVRQKHRIRQEECRPGPSCAVRAPTTREQTCCFQTSNTTKPETSVALMQQPQQRIPNQDVTSGSSLSTCKPQAKNPRLVVKKETSRRKHNSREEPNLEHYILLPTLVVRTPSNMKRQKKFNELYHRILNNAENCPAYPVAVDQNKNLNPNKKDIGFNISITLSNSAEDLSK
ncbi:uncharacterized protein LOC115440309 isoform X1 [Manduca sexta]|uniref:Uncharacterized protein n=3 Tax=Manduca sexta TaxID=7130 RepID=A0A921YJZ1_MANSE|nr:uncharacterized protein LOC115440309 isoform X1 [Manduca sexta]KAG6440665.1 hypothetical protein O3G_MSEX001406 [Manduca sexta]